MYFIGNSYYYYTYCQFYNSNNIYRTFIYYKKYKKYKNTKIQKYKGGGLDVCVCGGRLESNSNSAAYYIGYNNFTQIIWEVFWNYLVDI